VSSPFSTVFINISGNYQLDDSKTIVTIALGTDSSSSANAIITGGSGAKIYLIIPLSATFEGSSSTIVITDFHTSRDAIDLSYFPAHQSLADISYSTNPLTIILPSSLYTFSSSSATRRRFLASSAWSRVQPHLILSSHNDINDLSAENFLFFVDKNGQGNSGGSVSSMLDSSFYISLSILVACSLIVCITCGPSIFGQRKEMGKPPAAARDDDDDDWSDTDDDDEKNLQAQSTSPNHLAPPSYHQQQHLGHHQSPANSLVYLSPHPEEEENEDEEEDEDDSQKTNDDDGGDSNSNSGSEELSGWQSLFQEELSQSSGGPSDQNEHSSSASNSSATASHQQDIIDRRPSSPHSSGSSSFQMSSLSSEEGGIDV
jgi:hypothetical protein